MPQSLLKTTKEQQNLTETDRSDNKFGIARVPNPSLQRACLALLLSILLTVFTPEIRPVQAGSSTGPGSVESPPAVNLPSLIDFRRSLPNGPENSVVGVYVPGVMAFEVVQQPANNAAYVSGEPEVVTQFSLAAAHQTIGLLGHNYLAGKSFFELQKAQKIYLIYGDGKLKTYVISTIDVFQALKPDSPYSSFRELNNPGMTLSVEDVFYRIYGPGDRLVFQTCVASDGIGSWGRLFVTAFPVERKISYWNPHLIRQLEFE